MDINQIIAVAKRRVMFEKGEHQTLVHLDYPMPGISEDANTLSVSTTNGQWVAGCNLFTKSGYLFLPEGGFEMDRVFGERHLAVYDLIKRIWGVISNFDPEDQVFAKNFCDKAFDAVNPTLF